MDAEWADLVLAAATLVLVILVCYMCVHCLEAHNLPETFATTGPVPVIDPLPPVSACARRPIV
jgi:uncharacterized membrane protein YozB (DUF420 family)